MVPQSPARMESHGGVEEGRSHGRDSFDATMATIDGDGADGREILGADGETMFQYNIAGFGGCSDDPPWWNRGTGGLRWKRSG